MKTMKALIYEKPSVFAIQEVPFPSCGDDDVIIKVMASSICKGADRRHHTTGHKLGLYPITTGHEFAGYVHSVGSNVTNCIPGDRVTADNAVPCGKCYYCQREMYTHCSDFKSVGHNIPGGFAQYVKVKENSVFHVPSSISFNEACLTEPIACCIHAMDRLDVQYGEDVLVFGAGPNGMILSHLIKHSNANRIVTLASTQEKLDILQSYGIETILVDREDSSKHMTAVKKMFPHGVDAIVDATGSTALMNDGFQLLKKQGRLLQYSSTPDDADILINPAFFYRNELQYYTTYCQTHEFGRAIDALATERVKVDKMISKIFTLEDFGVAIEEVVDRNILKIIIRPNGLAD